MVVVGCIRLTKFRKNIFKSSQAHSIQATAGAIGMQIDNMCTVYIGLCILH